jgi:predicted nucleotidyltransferase
MLRSDVEADTIFLTLAGSKAYGTDNELSDTDVRGVCIPSDKTYYTGFGLNRFEQMDKGFDDDRVIYDLRKFLSLAIDCNPSILELLFIGQDKWISSTPTWEHLVQHRDKFLSKLARARFGGYAFQQLKRIRNHRRFLLNPPAKHPERSDFGLGLDKVLKADDIGAFQWLLSRFLKDSVQELNLSEATKAELYSTVDCVGLVQSHLTKDVTDQDWGMIQRVTNASDEFMATIANEKAYTNALNDWNAYQSWKTGRNEKRKVLEEKYKLDTKHAMHLVRLLRMAIEILESGQVIVTRPDAEELKAIRNGAWQYDQVEVYAEECDAKLNALYQTTNLPNQPDRVFIDGLCQQLIEEYVWR